MLPVKMQIVKLPRFANRQLHSVPLQSMLEIIALAIVLGLLVWVPPPDVNEAHYLAKAKHFWNRLWCPTDLFAGSHETHWLFYATFGWLTRFVSLEATAWIGRVTAWLVISWGLVKLIRCVDPRPWQCLLLAPMFVLINRYAHLAGEWFVGGVEAKAIAWGFVFAALARWLRRDWILVLFYLSVASGFHVVIGMWSLISVGMASLAVRILNTNNADNDLLNNETLADRPFSRRCLIAGLSVVLLTSGFLPAMYLNQNAPVELIRIASECQVFLRLAHHQDALQFGAHRWTAFLAMLSMWIVLNWANRPDRNPALAKLNWVALAAMALDVTGIALSVIAHTFTSMRQFTASILVLYWFRLADVLVPVVVVLNGFVWIGKFRTTSFIKTSQVTVVLVITTFIVWNAWSNFAEPLSGCARQALIGSGNGIVSSRDFEAERNWQRTCKWIGDNTPANSVFVTPANQQTFKWYANRSEVANWKDMPQDAAGVIDWNERLQSLYSGISQNDYGLLGLYDHEIQALANRYKADYLIVETRFVDWRESIGYSPAFEQVYPEKGHGKSTFTVFKLSDAINERIKQAEPVVPGDFH